MPRRIVLSLGLLVASIASFGANGCGGASPPGSAPSGEATGVHREAVPQPPQADKKDGGNASEGNAQVDRKIIYTATLDVVVKDLDAARAEVERRLADCKGYVAKSEARNDAGSRRTATYTLRVPVDRFRALVDALLELGTPERNAVDSQDVTEEYIDVQARIKNLKAEEEVLNKLLKESGSRDEVLKTREQIRTIRGDIERAQARLDYLSKLTALSTINLTLREIKDYKPPAAPTFRTRVSHTFENSWESFVEFLQSLALVAVALTPWLPLLVPGGLIGLWLLRKLWRAANTPVVLPSRPRAHLPRGHAAEVVSPPPTEGPPGEPTAPPPPKPE